MNVQPFFFSHPITAIPLPHTFVTVSMTRHIVHEIVLYIFVAETRNDNLVQ